MNLIKQTPKDSIIFEDNRVVVALAFDRITEGHCVVIWKDGEEDLNKLNVEDYEYLMDVIDVTRNVLRRVYEVEKVYLMYLDESNWVHWHLVPRYNKKGFNVLNHKPVRINDFKDTDKLATIFKEFHTKMIVEN